jgi:UDP-2,3-diacylglucosamine pyrophosphatase LpxH
VSSPGAETHTTDEKESAYMSIAGKRIAAPIHLFRAPLAANDNRRAAAHQKLTGTLQAASQVPFDDTSRFVFFGDCHRGADERTDAFAPNKELFRQVLAHYFKLGFTYVEVGDGDELWINPRFSDVQRAHRPIFDLLHQFDRKGRLHLLEGNHDVAGKRHDRKNKGGLPLREALVLQHAKTGQEILVAHGHQVDFGSELIFEISRWVVRHIWRRLQQFGFGTTPLWGQAGRQGPWLEGQIVRRLQAHKRKIEGRIVTWLQECERAIICGHTHLAHFASAGAPSYFNTGSCVIPGQITGLEIESGLISLVRWSFRTEAQQPDTDTASSQGTLLDAVRELVAPPRGLSLIR